MSGEDVILRFGGEIQGLSAALSRATSEISAAVSKMTNENQRIISANEKLEQSLGRTGATLTSLGTRMTALISLPIAAALTGAVKSAISFESAFANVAKTVDGVSDKFGKLTPMGSQLSQAIRDLAKEIPKTTEELSAIAAMAGQMGVKAGDIATFTKHVAALGVAVDGISGEEAAMALAQIGNVTGEGTKNIDKMASALVNLGNDGNSTEGAILEFTKRLVGAGNQMGLTTPEIMALGASMANLGINAEAGGTAFSQVMSKMGKAVGLGGQQLEAFAKVANMTADEFSTAFKTKPVAALQAFITGLATSQQRGANMYAILSDLGAEGIRLTDVLLRMSGAGTEFNRTLDVSNKGWQVGNKHLEEAEKKYGTTANQAKLMWNQIKDIGIVIGSAFIPAMKNAIDAATPFIQGLAAMAQRFTEMPGWVQGGSIAILGLVAAGGPMMLLAGQTATAVSEMMRLRREMQALSTASAVSQVGLLSGAIRGLLGLLGTATLVGGLALLGGTIAYAGYRAAEGGFAAPNELGIVSTAPPTVKEDYASQLRELYFHLSRQSLERQKAAALAGGAFSGAGGGGAIDPGAAAIATLSRLTAAYNADLKKLGAEGIAAVIAQHDRYGRGLSELATEYGVQESSLKRYIDLQKESAQAAEDAIAASRAHFAMRGATIHDFHGTLRESMKAQGFGSRMPSSDLLLENFGDFGTARDPRAAGLMAWAMGGAMPSATSNNASAGINTFDFSKFMRANMGGVVLQALTGGGNVGQSMGGLLGQGLTEKFMGGAAGEAISGMLGGVLGSVLPGLGTIAGSFIGTGIGKLFGGLFGGGEAKKTAGARDSWVESMGGLEELRKNAAIAGVSLDAVFNAKKVKDFEKAVKTVEKQMSAFAKRQQEMEANAAEFRQTFTGALDAVLQSGRLVPPQLQQIINKLRETGEMSEEIRSFTLSNAKNAAAGLAQFLNSANLSTKESVTSAVALVTSVFQQLMQSGLSAAQIMEQVGPSINGLKQKMRDLGVDGGAAFETIDRMAQYLADETVVRAVQSVNGLRQMMVGLHNSGLLNQDTFAQLSNLIGETFNDLIAKGYHSDEVLRLMQPDLQTIWELMTDFGYSVDESTAALVRQAQEAGIVGDKHRDASDRMATGIERLVLLMEDFLASLKEVPGAADAAANEVNAAGSDVKPWEEPWANWSPPPGSGWDEGLWDGGGGGDGGGDDGGGGGIYWNGGGGGSDAEAAARERFLRDNPGDNARWEREIKQEYGFHTGGIVGLARRAHNGAFLGPDEVPIIAQRGEGILSRHIGMPALSRLAGFSSARAIDMLNRGRLPGGGAGGGIVSIGDINVDARGARFENEESIDVLARKIEQRITDGLARRARIGMH